MVGLAALVDVSFGQGDAPAILKGLNQADKSIGATIKTPNGQVTKLSSSMALIETGNNNILENPNFEHSVYDTSWIIGSGSSSKVDVNIDSTKVFSGLNALKMTMAASTLGVFNVSPTGNQAYKDGVQGLVSVRIKTTVSGIRVCQRKGVSITTNCVNVVPDGKWNLYKVPSILGEFFNGVEITSSPTAVTGDVYIDDAFVGATDLTQNINACNNVNCETEFSVNVSATGVVSGENLDWISSCTNATTPVCTFNTGIFTVAPNCWMSFTGGDFQGNISSSATTVSGVRYSSAGVAQAGQRFYFCQKQGADFTAAKQLSNGNTYSSTNADTDWASCGHTTSSFTGLGTVTAINTQCKRQGGDLLMKGSFTVGTVTAVEARLSLPTWNGVQLTSAGTSVIPSLQLSGDMIYSSSSTVTFRHGTLIEPSVSYMTFAYQGSTNAAFQKILGTVMSANNQSFSFNSRIPIEGWQGSNIIVGSFSGLESCADTYQCTDVFTAKVGTAGAVSDENIEWITGNASVVSSAYTLTFKTGLFTVPPTCVFSTTENNNLIHVVGVSNSASSTTVRSTRTDSSTPIAGSFNIVCQKQGVDYIGKTAKAVASDQNIRTPGVTKAVFYSAKISSAGAVSDELGDFLSGSCSCATGNYTCTFNTSTFASTPNCGVPSPGTTADRSAYNVVESTSSVTFRTSNAANTGQCLAVELFCHGVSP